MMLLKAIFRRAIVPMRGGLPAVILLVIRVTAPSPTSSQSVSRVPLSARPAAARSLAQGAGNSEDDEVPPQDVEKYVAVYQAMQRDHTLTVEQAASRNGMSLDAFRQLENRVQRDDAAMEHVRDELKSSAVHASPGASPSAADSNH